ncbi:MAG: metalloregulator ArsR/SmtB family transcription factor, partial [Delftia acidovorans]|nr:metalloregulator ArsR/SmtB family transcription factor [Delftia acidovorans]
MPNTEDVLFKTLSDPTRRGIFEQLCREGEKTVGALTEKAGVSQPVVSKHLGVLKQAGLVRDRHEGRNTHYSAQLGALTPLLDWTRQMAGFWESRPQRGGPAHGHQQDPESTRQSRRQKGQGRVLRRGDRSHAGHQGRAQEGRRQWRGRPQGGHRQAHRHRPPAGRKARRDRARQCARPRRQDLVRPAGLGGNGRQSRVLLHSRRQVQGALRHRRLRHQRQARRRQYVAHLVRPAQDRRRRGKEAGRDAPKGRRL